MSLLSFRNIGLFSIQVSPPKSTLLRTTTIQLTRPFHPFFWYSPRTISTRIVGNTLPSSSILSPFPLVYHHPLSPRARTTFPAVSRPLQTTAVMASDQDYMAFLDKANQNLDAPAPAAAASTSTTATASLAAVHEGERVPEVIQRVIDNRFYVSESDEPFEGVALRWDQQEGALELPDEVTFSNLITHDKPNTPKLVSVVDRGLWNADGDYNDIIEAIDEATEGGESVVYRVETDSRTRVYYYVVGSVEGGKKLVGVKVLAIES